MGSHKSVASSYDFSVKIFVVIYMEKKRKTLNVGAGYSHYKSRSDPSNLVVATMMHRS